MDRLAVFIDAAYLDHLVQGPLAVRPGVPLQLDMKQLPGWLAGGTKPWRTFYYHAMPWVSDPPLPAEHAVRERKKTFIDFLARQPRWVLREGVVERRGGPKQGDWHYEQKRTDVALAVDLVRLAWLKEITHAVVVAGDSDFIPAVADARAAGVHVTLRFLPGTAHDDLLAACDARAPITAKGLAEVGRRG
jgi:hypothetical protein